MILLTVQATIRFPAGNAQLTRIIFILHGFEAGIRWNDNARHFVTELNHTGFADRRKF
jgi:hypothetical protein